MFLLYFSVDTENDSKNTGKGWIKCQTMDDCKAFIKENNLTDYAITCDESECYKLKNTVKTLSEYLENSFNHIGAYIRAWESFKGSINIDTDY